MGKKTIFNCAYLRVDVIKPWSRQPEPRQWLSAANDLAAQVKRHCDAEHVSVETDTEDVCEFCGYAWTEGNSKYNGGCCEEDAKAMEAIDSIS